MNSYQNSYALPSVFKLFCFENWVLCLFCKNAHSFFYTPPSRENWAQRAILSKEIQNKNKGETEIREIFLFRKSKFQMTC